MDIKYNSSNLLLLDDRSRQAKSIGVVDSRCQVCDFALFLTFTSLGLEVQMPGSFPVIWESKYSASRS